MAQTITAYLCCKDASAAIDFYTAAFGARERYRIPMADARVGHAELELGNSVFYLSDEAPDLGVRSPATLNGFSASFVLAVEDADGAWQRALDAGATVDRPIQDEPYGRAGWLFDPFGHRWNIQQPNPNFNPSSMVATA